MQILLNLIEHHGLWLVFANVLALQMGLPVPAYPTLIVVGAVAARSHSPLLQVVAVSTAACLIADAFWYVAGGRYGGRVLRLMCRLSLSPDTCVRQTESIYQRWGAPSLLVAKFVPGFATVATSMAGLMRTRWRSFALFDTLGAILWSTVAVMLGWLFRDAVNEVIEVFNQAGRWGLMVLATMLVLYIALKALQRYQLIRALRMARVSVEELSDMMGRGERPLVVDVRSQASQRDGHIPGALSIDSHAFDDSLKAHNLLDHVTRDVIVYCACPNEASAALIAKKLMRAGFKRVRPLGGGIEAWVERGYELEVGQR